MTEDIFMAIKLNPTDGFNPWKWTGGSDQLDEMVGIAAGLDNTMVLGGYTFGNWTTTHEGGEDFSAAKLDSDGEELWRYQNGTSGDDRFTSVAVGLDGAAVLGGFSSSNFVVVKLDTGGSFVWEWVGDSGDYDHGLAVAIADDESIVLAGTTHGSWGSNNAGTSDFAAVKLNSTGQEVWRWQESMVMVNTAGSPASIMAQDGTEENDEVSAVEITENGVVILSGYTEGAFSGDNAGADDMVAIALDAEGSELWRWQDGTSSKDKITGSMLTTNGSVVFGGYTEGSWDGTNAGGMDIFAVELSAANGAEVWRTQYGTAQDDECYGVAMASDSSLVLTGRSPGEIADVSFEGVGPRAFAVLLDTTFNTSASTNPPSSAPTLPPSPSATPAPSTLSSTAPTTRSTVPSAPPSSSTPERPVPSLTTAPTPLSTSSSSSSSTMSIIVGVSSAVGALLLLALVVLCLKRKTTPKSFQKPKTGAFTAEDAHVAAEAKEERTSYGPGVRGDPEEQSKVPLTLVHAEVVHSGQRRLPDETLTPSQVPLGILVGRSPTGSRNHTPLPSGGDRTRRNDTKADDGSIWKAQETESPSVLVTTTSLDSLSGDRTGDGEPTSGSRLGSDIAEMVLMAAQELADRSSIPGLSDAAALVSVLVQLVSDHSENENAVEGRLRWCRSIIILLSRASELLDKRQDLDSYAEAEQYLLEDVSDAIENLVQLIQAYGKRNCLIKVMTSSLFKTRQEEAEEAIDRALTRLQVGLQLQGRQRLDAVGQDVKEGLELQRRPSEESMLENIKEAMKESKRERRRRRLADLEIAEEDLKLTNEVLGKGGFGTVYLADLNGRNAAAKVFEMEHDLADSVGPDNTIVEMVAGETGSSQRSEQEHQRKAFMRELEAMTRLHSPHTVQLYGAVTTQRNRLIMVMEFLPGGDLYGLRRESQEPLHEQRTRCIMGDICAGMDFLHDRLTVHGDLKSANVLLDEAGRAKISDFGTSRWSRHTSSTGLATYSTAQGQNTKMSIPWAAPEVLDDEVPSFKSDVFSFGVVVWEVLTRQLPWQGKSKQQIIVNVIRGARLDMPDNAPQDLVTLCQECWHNEPEQRPTFGSLLETMRDDNSNEPTEG